jgi:hypothetical protein
MFFDSTSQPKINNKTQRLNNKKFIKTVVSFTKKNIKTCWIFLEFLFITDNANINRKRFILLEKHAVKISGKSLKKRWTEDLGFQC